jgi:hypothetical protein
VAEGREGEDGGGGAATLRAEGAELAKIGLLAGVVGDAASRAEEERGGDKADGEISATFEAEGRNSALAREPGPALAADPELVLVLLEPALGDSAGLRVGVAGPDLVGVEEEEAGVGEIVVILKIRELAGIIAGAAISVDSADTVEILATLAAKTEGEEEPRLVAARDEDLPLEGEEAGVWGIQGGVDGVALGDELVEAECEERAAVVGVLVAAEEGPADRVGAGLGGKIEEVRELGGDAPRAGERARALADEAAVLEADPEGGFEPGGERIGEEGGSGGGRGPGR